MLHQAIAHVHKFVVANCNHADQFNNLSHSQAELQLQLRTCVLKHFPGEEASFLLRAFWHAVLTFFQQLPQLSKINCLYNQSPAGL